MEFNMLDLRQSRQVSNCGMNIFPVPEYHLTRTMDVHDLLYVLEGNWGVRQNQISYSLKAGDALLLRANSLHTGSVLCAPYTRVYYIHFEAFPSDHQDDLKSEELTNYAKGNTACLSTLTECGKNEEVPRLMNEIISTFYSSRPDKQRLCAFQLSVLLNELAAISCASPPYNEEWIVRILRTFQSDDRRMFSLQELADIANLPVRTLSSKFRKITGQSPYQYQLHKKLDIARAQLVTTDNSIQEIAANIGFCDAYQFSRMFKKHFGQAPSAYRNNLYRVNINGRNYTI